MWLFRPELFLSAVAAPDGRRDRDGGPTNLVVRARCRRHLVVFRHRWCWSTKTDEYPSGYSCSEITDKGGTDYPFRVTMTRRAWAWTCFRMAMAIDYRNFKSAAAKVDPALEHACHEVWSVMRAFQTREERGDRKPGSYDTALGHWYSDGYGTSKNKNKAFKYTGKKKGNGTIPGQRSLLDALNDDRPTRGGRTPADPVHSAPGSRDPWRDRDLPETFDWADYEDPDRYAKDVHDFDFDAADNLVRVSKPKRGEDPES